MSGQAGQIIPGSPWPGRDDELRALWSEGLSARLIGLRMSLSRNAIIGRAHRLDLPKRASPIRQARTAEEIAARKLERQQRRLNRISRHVAPKLSANACQWIEGEPRPGQRWSEMPRCSEKAVLGRSWCPEHLKRCTVKVAPSGKPFVTNGWPGERGPNFSVAKKKICAHITIPMGRAE